MLNLDPLLVDNPSEGIGTSISPQSASSMPHPSTNDVSVNNKRSSERLKVNGRAKAMNSAGAIFQGKIVDISMTGVSVLMDDKPAIKEMVTLDCNIFQNGQPHVFQTKAMTVYAILSNGQFKVGFQFDPNNPVAKKIIEQLADR
jgi:hypothetical protein